MGVNYRDVYEREGRGAAYGNAKVPLIVGAEGAGTVLRGRGRVLRGRPGRLGGGAGVVRRAGGRARGRGDPGARRGDERAGGGRAPAGHDRPLPRATRPTRSSAGDVVVVHAAAGGVGLLLTQMIKALGGARAGDDVDRREGGAGAGRGRGRDGRLRAVSGAWPWSCGGAHVVYDAIGATTFEDGMAVVAGARMFWCSTAWRAGRRPTYDPQSLQAKSLYVDPARAPAVHRHARGAARAGGRRARLGRGRLARRAHRRALPARGRPARPRGPGGAPDHRKVAVDPVTYQRALVVALFGCMTTSTPDGSWYVRATWLRWQSSCEAAAEGDQRRLGRPGGPLQRTRAGPWRGRTGCPTVDASDVVQTTWLRLVEHLGRLQDPERVGAWLATTARRECLRTLRHSARQVPTEELPETGRRSAHLDAALLVEERDRALWQAFGGLSERCQTLLRILVADPPAELRRDRPPRWTCRSGASVRPAQRCLERLRGLAEGEGVTADRSEGTRHDRSRCSRSRACARSSRTWTRSRRWSTTARAPRSAGARSTPTSPSSCATAPTRWRRPASARRGGPRQLSFESPALGIELEVVETGPRVRRVEGQLLPPGEATVTVERPDGEPAVSVQRGRARALRAGRPARRRRAAARRCCGRADRRPLDRDLRNHQPGSHRLPAVLAVAEEAVRLASADARAAQRLAGEVLCAPRIWRRGRSRSGRSGWRRSSSGMRRGGRAPASGRSRSGDGRRARPRRG